MSQAKLILYALGLEISALIQLGLGGARSDLQLLAFMAIHALASACLAVLAQLAIPARLQSPRWATWLFIFCISAFIPILGFLAILIGLLVVPYLPSNAADKDFRAVRLPELDPHERHGVSAFRQAGLRQFLNNERAPMDQRLKALVTLQNAPVRFASPLLRDLLAAPAEDLRLLAYGMLESRERKLNADIHAWRLAWQDATDEATRHGAARRLSALYWELIYQGLEQGDLRRHAAEESLRFLEPTLRGEPDASLHLRHGHLLHELHRNDEAEAAYRRAVELGLPAPRVQPYLAELAFDRRDFAEVVRLLGTLREYPDQRRLQPLLQFWGIA